MGAASLLVIDGEVGKRVIPLVPRSPRLPLPQPITYDHVLPFAPPPRPSLNFYRGQMCGIRIPGAPPVPGCGADPSLVMTALLDRYVGPAAWVQDAFLLKYAEDGYTDLQRSFGHAMPFSAGDWTWPGVSLQQFIALTQKAQREYGLQADQWILGGDALYNCNQPLSYWRPIIDSILDPLLVAGAIDKACVGWQLDQLFGATPGNATIEVIAYIAQKLPARIPLFTHWMNEALAWWKTGGEVWVDQWNPDGFTVRDRFTWWLAMRPYLTGGHHQGDNKMAREDPKLYQDKLKDTLDAFHDGRMGMSRRSGVEIPFQLTGYEETAQNQFDNECSEDEGDRAGAIILCTTSGTGAGLDGYGNGDRTPEGLTT